MTDIKSAFNAPEDIRSTLHDGLSVIASLSKRDQEKLLKWARVPRAAGLFGDSESLASEIGLSQERARQARLAVAMMLGSLRESSITAEEFINAGLKSSAFTKLESVEIGNFAELIIAVRHELNEESELVQLQNAVLPTLTEFDLTIDARVQVSEGAVMRAVPVVIAYVDTDAEDQLVWFQMDEERARELRDKLTATLDHIETLKEWLDKSIKS
ncbi:MAG: hypothetical protein OXC15_05395 [Rhodospirillaceae bacterium]|nr:hypothetical protein [Rhodospirillaceae bacterium]